MSTATLPINNTTSSRAYTNIISCHGSVNCHYWMANYLSLPSFIVRDPDLNRKVSTATLPISDNNSKLNIIYMVNLIYSLNRIMARRHPAWENLAITVHNKRLYNGNNNLHPILPRCQLPLMVKMETRDNMMMDITHITII